MTREEALALIDVQTKIETHPVKLLHWVHLRVIINQLSDEAWTQALQKAEPILSR